MAQRPLPGVEANVQFQSLAEAASKLAPGDRLVVHSGIYREEVVINASGSAEEPIMIRAADGEQVIVTAADRITDWTLSDQEKKIYSAPWTYEFNASSPHYAHPGDEYHRLIGRCEQVLVNGYALHQVLERSELSRGTFYVDSEAQRLFIRPANNADISSEKTLVEASTRQQLCAITGNHVHVKGIRFRYAANRAQRGAVDAVGSNLRFEDCIFEQTNSSGAAFRGQDIVVRNCTFQFNGQLGFGAKSAHRLRITNCTVRHNNTKDFDRDWEAGGDKIVLTRGAILEHSTFIDNRGHGIWFDIGNEDCVVRNCLLADNENGGIFYEISYGLHAHDNVIVNNGLAFAPNSWGASAGISLSSSPGCRIDRNLFVGNKEGFAFREQIRSTPRLDRRWEVVWNHDQTVSHNIFFSNRDAQVAGWFDVPDERIWPKAMQVAVNQNHSSPSSPLPSNLSLEELDITFEKNLYSPGLGHKLFQWGVPWKRHKIYHSLDEIESELSLAEDSVVEELSFQDSAAYDFRIPADSQAIKMKCYPRGTVPGVSLGILELTND